MQISRLTASALGTYALIAMLAGCNSAGSRQLTPIGFRQQADSARHPKAAHANLYVTNYLDNSVTVYLAKARGNATPRQTISGSNTTLYYPSGIALDTDKDTYVVNGRLDVNVSLTVYAAGSNGNIAPVRTISGDNTGLVDPEGIALDADGTTYVVNAEGSHGSVNVYAADANGNVAPIRDFYSTGLSFPRSVALDTSSDAYVVSRHICERGRCAGTDQVIIYAAGASGNVTPLRTISGSNTGLNRPCGITLDPDNNAYVTNEGGNRLTAYAAGATGNVTPIRTISGLKTRLNSPCGIALDSDNNTYVTNEGGNSVTVYAADANGNVEPMRTIHGSKTGLAGPYYAAIH
jgi:sugar lactone lactonase YvrE